MVITVFLLVIVIVILVWACGFIYANDFSVKTITGISQEIKKAAVIFPHADDEAFSSSGLMSVLTHHGIEVQWIILTKGERGTADGSMNEPLKSIRVQEARKAAEIYGVKKLIQKEYPDGGLAQIKDRLKSDLKETIDKFDPDLVITYDLSGLYGHPDHITASEVVTWIVKSDPNIQLWYISMPKRMLDSISLPEHMANDRDFKAKRTYPSHKIRIGVSGVINKIKVATVYKSQGGSSSQNMPVKFIPFWVYLTLAPFEYFHEVQ